MAHSFLCSSEVLNFCQLAYRHRLLQGNGFSTVNRVSRLLCTRHFQVGAYGWCYSTPRGSRLQAVPRPRHKTTPTPLPPRHQGTGDRRKMLLLIIPITTFCLGTWQIFRLQWKLGLIEELERKTRQAPLVITRDILDNVDEMEYCRVTLSGYFDHNRELHMWPRTLNTADVSTQRNPEPGACVITPFYCYELEQWILVNRGWVPRRRMDPSTRSQGQVEGDVKLAAVVRAPEKRAPFSPENDPAHNHWSYKDVARMAEYADTAPFFVDADATTTVTGGPIGGQTRVSVRNEHLQYVFTWYALSLFTGYMFYLLWRKARRGGGKPNRLRV